MNLMLQCWYSFSTGASSKLFMPLPISFAIYNTSAQVLNLQAPSFPRIYLEPTQGLFPYFYTDAKKALCKSYTLFPKASFLPSLNWFIESGFLYIPDSFAIVDAYTNSLHTNYQLLLPPILYLFIIFYNIFTTAN